MKCCLVYHLLYLIYNSLICLYRPFDAAIDDDCVPNDNHSIPVTMDTIPVLQHSMVNTFMVILLLYTMIYVVQKPGAEIHFSGNIVFERLTPYNMSS